MATSFDHIPFGTPDAFNVLVEIPAGSQNKYEVDDATGMLMLDYVFHDGFCFPFNYGFVPHTKAEDGDPLDVVVLSTAPMAPLTVVAVKPIALLRLKDSGEQDNKLITVPVVDPLAKKYHSLADLSRDEQEQIKDFFTQIGVQKNKIMDIEGFFDKDKAIQELERCRV